MFLLVQPSLDKVYPLLKEYSKTNINLTWMADNIHCDD